MMKAWPFLLLLFSAHLMANSTSNDFGRSDTKKEFLTANDLRQRLEVLGEIFVVDENGKILLQADESRLWKFGSKGDLVSNWSFRSGFMKELALRHVWSLGPEGKIQVHLAQYDSMKRKDGSREVVLGKLLREQKIELKDFSTISWAAAEGGGEKVIVRLTPRLGEKSEFIEMESLPLSLGAPVIFDNKGRLWAQGRDLEGRYIGLTTHVGKLAMSFVPFKGAKLIGQVQGHQIILNGAGDLKVFIRSTNPIVTSSRPAKIYGFLDLNLKTDSVNSVHSSSGNKEKEFLEHL